ncbi:ATP-binding domain-containing protein [Streptomyces sp. KK5PA1]|uniref:ATP-binding domain-containing protein n=1 Tax=Actinacidiphila acididurans TaxID=2784346 RepID=A0ABS2U1H0_9ACTN|nr:ATP-binding domain-containing protein [Actinacidiphila acididurans]
MAEEAARLQEEEAAERDGAPARPAETVEDQGQGEAEGAPGGEDGTAEEGGREAEGPAGKAQRPGRGEPDSEYDAPESGEGTARGRADGTRADRQRPGDASGRSGGGPEAAQGRPDDGPARRPEGGTGGEQGVGDADYREGRQGTSNSRGEGPDRRPEGGTGGGPGRPGGSVRRGPDDTGGPGPYEGGRGPEARRGDDAGYDRNGAPDAPGLSGGRRGEDDARGPGPRHGGRPPYTAGGNGADSAPGAPGGAPGDGGSGRRGADDTPGSGPRHGGRPPYAAGGNGGGNGADSAPGGPEVVGSGRAAVDPRAVEGARGVLTGGGAPGELAEAVVRLLGEGAGEALRQDPWLVLGVPGVRVEQADGFARAVLGGQAGPGDERRGRALVGFVLEKAAQEGHTALGADAVKAALGRHGVPDPEAAVTAAVEDGGVLLFRDESVELPADEDEETDVPLLLGLDKHALAEESLADGCVRLLRSFEAEAVAVGEEAEQMWERAAAGAPSSSAAQLIRTAAASGLVLHTGGEAARAEPAALVNAARAAGLRAYAAAYTDNGRRRLAEAVGEQAAVTVEGLLTGRGGPGRAPDSSLALDLLAVLDAPLLSAEEAATLVEALPDGVRLVFSGDENALWSAGPGRAFADLLASKACPRVTSRTPDPGPIGELTSYVSVGELPAVEAPDKEVVVVPVRDPDEAVLRTVQLVADSVPRAIGVPADRTQVIAIAHGGPVGTRALNAALKERLNPGPGRFGGFDPGDRVVIVTGPGHALLATVVGAEPTGLRLDSERGPVLVPREDVATAVRHGWALTGHQAAGMRWPAVVVVVPGDAGALLNRAWVYTAFARGERHLSVVQGAEQGLPQAVAEGVARARTTRLGSVLKELAAGG